MIERIFGLLAWLIPPHDSLPEEVRIRLGAIAMISIANSLAVVLLVLCAHGAVPWYSGFALTSDVEGLTDQFRQQEVRLLDQALLEMKLRQCKAGDVNPDAKRFATERLGEMQREYLTLTGHYPALPQCEELI